MLKAARESTGHEFQQAEMTQKELEKQLRQKDWELDDVKAMSHARSVVDQSLPCSAAQTQNNIHVQLLLQSSILWQCL